MSSLKPCGESEADVEVKDHSTPRLEVPDPPFSLNWLAVAKFLNQPSETVSSKSPVILIPTLSNSELESPSQLPIS